MTATPEGINVDTPTEPAGLLCRVQLRRERPSPGSQYDNKNHNLFARLSPSTLTALLQDAVTRSGNKKQPASGPEQEQHETWSFDTHVKSKLDSSSLHWPSLIEFLPLEIRFRTASPNLEADSEAAVEKFVYASYNGGLLAPRHDNSAYDNAPRNDEMTIQLSDALLLQQNDAESGSCHAKGTSSAETITATAWVRILTESAIPNATEVNVQPLTQQDWDQLQQASSKQWLEQGGLLQQVSLVYAGQVLRLFVNTSHHSADGQRKEWVTVKVESWSSRLGSHACRGHQGSSSGEGEDQLMESELEWPADDTDDDGDDSNGDDEISSKVPHYDTIGDGGRQPRKMMPPCCRLVADAEVVVLPPPPSQHPCNYDKRIRLTPCRTWQDYGPSMRDLYQKMAVSAARMDESQSIAETKRKKFRIRDIPRVSQGMVKVHPEAFRDILSQSFHLLRSRKQSTGSQQAGYFCMDESEMGDSAYVQIQIQLEESSSHIDTPRHAASVAGSGHGDVTLPQNRLSHVALMEPCDSVPRNGIALHPLTCPKLRIRPLASRHSVTLVPLAPLEAEEKSLQVWNMIQQGCVRAILHPVEVGRVSSENFNAETAQNSLAPSSAFSAGSLVDLDGLAPRGIYELRLEYNQHQAHTGDGSDTTQDLFLLGSHFVQLCTENASIVDRSSYRLMPDPGLSGQDPVLDLLPMKTTVPSSLVEDLVPRCMRDCSVLIYGASGSGKSHTAKLYAAMTHLAVPSMNDSVYFDCGQEKEQAGMLDNLLEALTALVTRALAQSPSIIILDNFDEICPNLDSSLSESSSVMEQSSPVEIEQAKVVRDHLQSLLAETSKMGSEKISIIATSRDATSVAWKFRRRIRLPLLNASEKLSLLQSLLPGPLHSSSSSSSTGLPQTFLFQDLLPQDLVVIAARVQHELHSSTSAASTSTSLLLERTLQTYIPLGRRSAQEEPRDLFFDWNDIGGLFKAKKALEDMVIRPIKFRRIYETSRIRLPRGALLFGPSGVGKSILPMALCKLAGLPLIFCRGPEILDRFIGASEAKVRALFERAAMAAPSVLFIDEIDSLAPHRGSDVTGVTDRVVNQLLTFLDGVEDVAAGKSVYVLASSSRPDKIDSALLRPGRLEKHIFVGLSESADELVDVFTKISNKYQVDEHVKDAIVSGAFVREYMDAYPRLRYYSASDIKAVFDTAHLQAVQDFLASCPSQHDNEETLPPPPPIELSHLKDAMRLSRPSLSEPDRLRLGRIYSRFQDPNRGDRPAESETSGQLWVSLK